MLDLLDSLLIFIVNHLGERIERLLDALLLQGANLEEFEAYGLSESHAVLRANLCSRFEVHLVGNDDTGEVSAGILLLHLVEPSLEQVESIGVGHVIDEDDHVGSTHELERDLFKDVLASHIDEMQLDSRVIILLIELDVLDMIVTTLSHHVVVVELLIDSLCDEASLADRGFTGDDYTRAQNGHFSFYLSN